MMIMIMIIHHDDDDDDGDDDGYACTTRPLVSKLRMLTSAPAPMSNRTTSSCPLALARISGV